MRVSLGGPRARAIDQATYCGTESDGYGSQPPAGRAAPYVWMRPSAWIYGDLH